MWANNALVRKPNIVAVYEAIDIDQISVDAIRKVFGSEKPVVQIVPGEIIAIIYPELGPMACTIGNKRVRVEAADYTNIEKMTRLAREANRIVGEKNKQIAYGFNYEIIFEGEELPSDEIAQSFLKDSKAIEDKIGGDLVETEVKLTIQKENIRLQFVLRQEGNILVSRANVHFETEKLPSEVSIKRSFRSWADEAKILLDKLYECSDD